MDVKQVLEGARGLLENRWARGYYTDGLGGYCLAGAINISAGEMQDVRGTITYAAHDREVKKVAFEARLLACNFLPEPFETLPTYNDAPGTTQQDVLAVLDKAISAC